MTFKVIRGQGQGEEMTSVPLETVFYFLFTLLPNQSNRQGGARAVDLPDQARPGVVAPVCFSLLCASRRVINGSCSGQSAVEGASLPLTGARGQYDELTSKLSARKINNLNVASAGYTTSAQRRL